MRKAGNKKGNSKKWQKHERRDAYSDNPRPARDKDVRKSYGETRDTSGLNDVSWYKRYPGLLETAGRVAFPYRPGRTINYGSFNPGAADVAASLGIPGVMVLEWIPSFGHSSSVTDPASIAAKEIYAKVRSKFSGALDADGPDFIMYMGALDSIFSYIASLKRVYRLLDAYSPDNYATPDAILQSLGYAPNDIVALRSDKANFNLIINELIKQSQKFAMPDVMDMFRRHYWLNDNVYTDAGSINSQFYTFSQRGFFKFTMLNTAGGTSGTLAGGLSLVEAPANLKRWAPGETNPTTALTVAALYEFGRDLIDTLAESDDAYTISGYLMRAYEGAAQFVVDELPIMTSFAPVYAPEVLAQIENSWGVCLNTVSTHWNYFTSNPAMVTKTFVTQNPATNAVLHTPQMNDTGMTITAIKPMLSIRSDVPSVDEIVVATRLAPAIEASGTSNIWDLYCGTEIPLCWTIVWPKEDTGWQCCALTSLMLLNPAFNTSPAGIKANYTQLQALMLETQFDWSPFVRYFMSTRATLADSGNATDISQGAFFGVNGDLHNVTVLSAETLKDINRVCVYSELNAFSE